MNGLLTALLGGASGAAQGLGVQRERDLRQQALEMEKAKMKADLYMQGFDPDAPQGPPPPQSPSISQPQAPGPMAAPQPVQAAPQYIPSQYGGGGPRPMLPPPSAGAVSGTDVMRQTAKPQTPTPDTGPFNLSAFMQTDGKTLNLPGVGNYSYNFARSPMARTYIMDALKNKMLTDEKIREAGETGTTAKNLREAGALRLGDKAYAGAVGEAEAAKAMATLPVELQKMVAQGRIGLASALQQIGARGQVEAGLQGNQQNFTAGENSKNRTHATELQQSGQAGSFINASALKSQEAQGSLSGKLFAPPPSTVAPSSGMNATPAQKLWDAAVALHGQEKVLKEYGPRP